MTSEELFIFKNTEKYFPEVEEWLSGEPHQLYAIARHWFKQMRLCGDDVTELLHDGYPVACVDNAAFAYVNVFRNHVNIGFFTGAFLNDPKSLLEGTGKRMRHVKLRPDAEIDSEALTSLIDSAYADVKSRL